MARKKSSSKDLNDQDYKTLDEIEQALRLGQYDEANSKLRILESKSPSHIDVLYQRCHFLAEVGNLNRAWWHGYRIIKKEPDHKNALSDLINLSAELQKGWATIHFIDQYQEHSIIMPSRFTRLREEVVKINDLIIEKESDLALHTQEELTKIDFAMILINADQINEAEKVTKPLLKKPKIAKRLYVLNLIRLIEQGKLEECLEYIEQTSDQFPDDVFIKSTQIIIHYMMGHHDHVQAESDRLIGIKPKTAMDWLKRIEMWAITGKSERLLEDYQAFLEENPDFELEPTYIHYVATAHALTGDKEKAYEMWQDIEDVAPEIALENLAHRQAIPSYYNGISYFELRFFMPTVVFQSLNEPVHTLAQAKRHFEKHFKKYPWLENMFTILLQRGNFDGRDFAIHVSRHYPIVPALKEFAVGTQGVDYHRLRALNLLIELEEISKDALPDIMMNGEWKKPHLLAYEVTYESNKSNLPKTAIKLLEQAHDLIDIGKLDAGLDIVEKAQEISPDNETLMHFEYICLKGLGFDYDADEVREILVDMHPDYLFTRVEQARYHIKQQEFDEAEKWLDPIKKQTKFHVSELKAYGITMIEWLLKHEQSNEVMNWTNQLEAIEPAWQSDLDIYRQRASMQLSLKDMLSSMGIQDDETD